MVMVIVKRKQWERAKCWRRGFHRPLRDVLVSLAVAVVTYLIALLFGVTEVTPASVAVAAAAVVIVLLLLTRLEAAYYWVLLWRWPGELESIVPRVTDGELVLDVTNGGVGPITLEARLQAEGETLGHALVWDSTNPVNTFTLGRRRFESLLVLRWEADTGADNLCLKLMTLGQGQTLELQDAPRLRRGESLALKVTLSAIGIELRRQFVLDVSATDALKPTVALRSL